jgi:hypothetical protein
VVSHLRADSLGNWLPFALADVVTLLAAAVGAKTDRYKTMRGWGLEVDDLESEANESEYQAGIDRLASILGDLKQ